jgi:DNA-binding response OmpR family regulator
VSREAIDAAIHPRQAMLGPEGGTDGHEAVSNVVDVIVLRLRKKLGHELIQTRRGQGFIIDG